MEIKWLDEEEKDPCGYYGMYPPMSFVETVLNISKASLEQVRQLCLDLVNEASLHNNTAQHNSSRGGGGLWTQLQRLSTPNGLRLEATRGILGARHGDLMIMAYNQHILSTSTKVSPRQYKTVFLSQFMSSKANFRSTAQVLCEFGQSILVALNPPKSTSRCVEDFVRWGWVRGKAGTLRDPSHVTSNQLSTSEREVLIKGLKQDSVLGDPLLKLEEYMMQFSWEADDKKL
jgi:hypothetical protein